MPRKPNDPNAESPRRRSTTAGAEARGTLADLIASGFGTAELMTALADRRTGQDRSRFARSLIEAAVEAHADRPRDAELPTQVATLLGLLVGAATAADLLLAALRAAGGQAEELFLLSVGDALGVAFLTGPDRVLPPLPPEVGQALASALDDGEEGFYALLERLLATPEPVRRALVEALLASGGDAVPAFAAFCGFSTLDGATQAAMLEWLARHAPAPHAWIARRQAGEAPGPAPIAVLPLDWPVVEAYATFPDGCGSQGLYAVRQRPDERYAVLSAVVNDWRGLADGAGHPRLTRKEAEKLLAHASGAGLVPLSGAEFQARLVDGLARTNERGLPIPFMLRAHWPLFQGLPGGAAAEPIVPAPRATLADTAALADEDWFQRWYLHPTDDPATRAFFQRARPLLAAPQPDPRSPEALMRRLSGSMPPMPDEAALDAAIQASLGVVFDAAARTLWAGRLREAARLFERLGEPKRRDLAAIAAAAMAPDSGVPLADQPVPALILHQSAYRDAMRADEAMFEGLQEILAAASQPRRAPARPTRPAGAASVFQLKIALKGAKPPIWRRVLVESSITLPRLHDVIQRAMGWQDYHLHGFRIGGAAYGPPDDFMDVASERGKRLDALVAVGDRFEYAYDFGDGWEHRVTVEKALALDPERGYPACVAGKGACPPEDSGGLWGYYAKLEALADPRDPEHAEVSAWLGAGFDPGRFDLEEANARLMRKRASQRGIKRRGS